MIISPPVTYLRALKETFGVGEIGCLGQRGGGGRGEEEERRAFGGGQCSKIREKIRINTY